MTEENIPHAARMMNQFRVEEGAEGTKKNFVSTGKVMCWCNCGEMTGWFDLFEGAPYTGDGPAQKFFQEHQIAEEIGIRMGYVLGELAGYSIELSGIANPEFTLLHRCGWQKDLSSTSAENLLTNIVMEAQSNTHICGEVKQ